MSASVELRNMMTKVSDDCTPAKRKSEDLVGPVSPCSSGKGLPYAPVDWPNPGDVWSWRVGRRRKVSGCYNDRFLYGPESLQERPGKQLLFQSKLAVVRYLNSNFPEADIDSFFASFTWEIPGKEEGSKKGKIDTRPQALSPGKKKGKMLRGNGVAKRTRKAALRVKGLTSSEQCGNQLSVDMSSVEEQTLASGAITKALGSSQVSDSHTAISPDVSECHSPLDLGPQGPKSLDESQVALVPVDFDNFINSLDEILALPSPNAEISRSATSQREGMTEIRAKLLSLLSMGFSSLVASNKLKQLTALSSKLLQYDPTLSPGELSMLKLIQEIPLASNNFLEAEKLVSQADKFFADLDAKIARVASLKNEYNEAKEQLELCQAKESSALLSLLEIDEQIAALQSRRAELTQTIKATNRKIVQFSSGQKKVMESLPKIVHEVQLANSEKEEWELKKKRSADQVAEILEKFAPLQGFSF